MQRVDPVPLLHHELRQLREEHRLFFASLQAVETSTKGKFANLFLATNTAVSVQLVEYALRDLRAAVAAGIRFGNYVHDFLGRVEVLLAEEEKAPSQHEIRANLRYGTGDESP